MRFCGIDLHSNNSFIVIIDEQDRVMYSRRHANRLTEILEAIAPYQSPIGSHSSEQTIGYKTVLRCFQGSWAARVKQDSALT